MKQLLLTITIIFYINCAEYILKAGKKTEGLCKKTDYEFSFENSFYQNEIIPKKDYEFKVLMDKNIISIYQVKKKNILSKNFEILCRIKDYHGCSEFSDLKPPRLLNKEPKEIILKNGDIIHFEGFINQLSNLKEKININEVIVKETNEKEKFLFFI